MKTAGAEFGTGKAFSSSCGGVDRTAVNLLARRFLGFENFLQSWKRSVETVYIAGSS